MLFGISVETKLCKATQKIFSKYLLHELFIKFTARQKYMCKKCYDK